MDVLCRSVVSRFEQYVKLNKKIPPEILTSLSGIDAPGPPGRHRRGAHGAQARGETERFLEIADVKTRLEHVLGLIDGEIDVPQNRENASAAASSSRWRRASASTTSMSR